MINIGDRVKFVSDTGVGHVTRIEGNYVYVDMEDGFEIPAMISDVVVVNEEDELEAMSRIGMGDEKPGRKKKSGTAATGEKKRPSTKEPAYRKYGKIALVNDYSEDDEEFEEEEDEDMIPDVLELKEKYIKNLTLRREREAQMEQSRLRQQQEKERTNEAGTPKAATGGQSANNGATKESNGAENKDNSAGKEDKHQQKEEPKEKNIAGELSEAMMSGPKKTKKEKEENDGMEVVDLHAEEVLSETEGLTSGQILDAQMARYTFTLDSLVNSKKHGKIVFIHGVGKGKLKYEMLKVLKRDYPKMDYQDASFKEYGYGAIIVYY